MGLLQELPSSEQLTSILDPVMGDEAAGTGVTGIFKLLEGIDTSKISASFSIDLTQSVMGTIPNTISIHGTKHGDEARDSFLESIRETFNAGVSTTFVADINTATDLSDDSPAAQQLATAYGRDPSELIPTGQDAVLVLDQDPPLGTPPTVLLRREVLDEPTG